MTNQTEQSLVRRPQRHPSVLIVIAALLAISPLLVHGGSCGQDQPFHLQSWLDASSQLLHGHYPQWAYSPAWNAGEPRFVFYPPLSWLLGAGLALLLPIQFVPIVFILFSLAISGVTMNRLAREFMSPAASLLSASFYLANPYMLFCAFERAAFGELLAAAWMPLLLQATLRARPTVRSMALPFALLWLTNAPAAVIGSYAFAVLAMIRVMRTILRSNVIPWSMIWQYILGAISGLALSAFYVLPAAYERRFVQVAMAIIPNMRYQDNFLFTRTADVSHNAVNHTVSWLACTMLLITLISLGGIWVSTLRSRRTGLTAMASPWLMPAGVVFMTILVLLNPISAYLWRYLPEFAFLQFPWRLLMVLAPIPSLSLASLWDRWVRASEIDSPSLLAMVLLLPLALGGLCFQLYAQRCDLASQPNTIARLFRSGYGAPPTDEYTPINADNDVLRTDDPAFWLATDPNAAAPGTTPTPSQLNPNIETDDAPIPIEQMLSTPAPMELTLHLLKPRILVLHLRDYPAWKVASYSSGVRVPGPLERVQRDDGLIAIQLPAGSTTLRIHWQRTWDQSLGLAISLLASLSLGLTWRLTRRRTPRLA